MLHLDQVAGPARPLSEEIERENVVVGVAHLCFSEDGSWFQVCTFVPHWQCDQIGQFFALWITF